MLSTCLAFGVVFQLPIVVLALTALGLVTPRAMMKYRRHALAGSVVVSAVVTPGDLLLMTALMALPLYALYEISIVVSWGVHRSRQRRLAREEAIGGTVG